MEVFENNTPIVSQILLRILLSTCISFLMRHDSTISYCDIYIECIATYDLGESFKMILERISPDLLP